MSSKIDEPPSKEASGPFIANASGITRKNTGSEFKMSSMPPNHRLSDCEYRNPNLGLKVGFEALTIVEQVPTEPRDGSPSVKILTGFLVVEDHLYNRLYRNMLDGPKSTKHEEIDRSARDCVDDCYELMLEYILWWSTQHHWHPVFSPGIYEVDAFALRCYLAEDSPDARRAAYIHRAGPEVVVRTGAKRIR